MKIVNAFEETGFGIGFNIGGGGGRGEQNPGTQTNNSPNTGGVSTIGITGSMKDIYIARTNEKSGIDAQNININVGGTTTDLTNKADRHFTDADFEGNISMPMKLLTKEGRKTIAKEYRGYKELLGGLKNIQKYKDFAFENDKIDPSAHQKARQGYYSNVHGQGAAFTGIVLTELFQGFYYTVNANEGYNTFSIDYWKDTGQDIQEAINASNGIIQPGFQSQADLDKFNEMLFKNKND